MRESIGYVALKQLPNNQRDDELLCTIMFISHTPFTSRCSLNSGNQYTTGGDAHNATNYTTLWVDFISYNETSLSPLGRIVVTIMLMS